MQITTHHAFSSYMTPIHVLPKVHRRSPANMLGSFLHFSCYLQSTNGSLAVPIILCFCLALTSKSSLSGIQFLDDSLYCCSSSKFLVGYVKACLHLPLPSGCCSHLVFIKQRCPTSRRHPANTSKMFVLKRSAFVVMRSLGSVKVPWNFPKAIQHALFLSSTLGPTFCPSLLSAPNTCNTG